MGVHAGRKNGNSAVLLKESLISCQEMSAEITLINLHDYKINSCTGCVACTRNLISGKTPRCVWDDKDDMEKIMEIFLQQDGFILGVPTYDLMPAGIYINFSNRFIRYEACFQKESGISSKITERVAGIIATGGSTRSWMSMVLEGINATMFTQSIKVVDQFLATRCNLPGQVTLYPDYLERVKKMGKNIVSAIRMPEKKREWLGDDDGWCPICHSNNLSLGEPHWDGVKFKIECQVCGTGGDLVKNETGNWVFVPASNGLEKCRILNEGRINHFYEIQEGMQFGQKNIKLIQQRMERYKNITFKTIE